MRRLSRSLCLLVCSLLGQSLASADERILAYEATITVNDDSTLDVRETIRVRAEGLRIRRGIYKDFRITPYRGPDQSEVEPRYEFGTPMRDFRPVQARVEAQDFGVRYFLGGLDETLTPGEHTYEIRYRTSNLAGFGADHDELYWNVTGSEWEFPIDRAVAQVVLPGPIPRDKVRFEAFTGRQGSQGTAYTAGLSGGAVNFGTTRPLSAHEGLTIRVVWPKGFIQPGTGLTSIAPRVGTPVPEYSVERANGVAPPPSASPANASGTATRLSLKVAEINGQRPLILAGLGLLFVIGYHVYLRLRQSVGRDVPANLSPGVMRYLHRGSYDEPCFVADVLSLVAQGHLAFDARDGEPAVLRKRSPTAQPAPPGAQSVLLQALFDSADEIVPAKDSSCISWAQNRHRDAMDWEFGQTFFRFDPRYVASGYTACVVIAFLTLVWPGPAGDWLSYFVTPLGLMTLALVGLCLLARGVFGAFLRQPTPVSAATARRIGDVRQSFESAGGELTDEQAVIAYALGAETSRANPLFAIASRFIADTELARSVEREVPRDVPKTPVAGEPMRAANPEDLYSWQRVPETGVGLDGSAHGNDSARADTRMRRSGRNRVSLVRLLGVVSGSRRSSSGRSGSSGAGGGGRGGGGF